VLAAAAIPGVLPTQNPGDRGLPRPPRAALAAAVHAITLLTNACLQDDLSRYASAAELIVLPALNPPAHRAHRLRPRRTADHAGAGSRPADTHRRVRPARRWRAQSRRDVARPDQAARLPWALAGAGAEFVSMAAFGQLQRVLLRAAGARLTVRSILATAYTASAIAISVPAVGSALRRLMPSATSAAVAPTQGQASIALTAAGVLSNIAFAILAAAGATLTGNPAAAALAAAGSLAGTALVARLVSGVREPDSSDRRCPIVRGTPPPTRTSRAATRRRESATPAIPAPIHRRRQ
jgi:hypothetical protein